MYADDKQAYTGATPSAVDGKLASVLVAASPISAAGAWCSSRRLQLNESKTELAWFGIRSRLVKLADVDNTVTIGTNIIQSTTTVVRDLGVLLDAAELTVEKHVDKVTSTCLYQLHDIHVCRSPAYLAICQRGSRTRRQPASTRTGDIIEYRLPRCRSALGERVFSVAGPLAWNKLLPALRDISDRKQFR